MKQLLLLGIAILLAIALLPIGFFFHLCTKFRTLKSYFYSIALSIDQLGNVVCQALFNWTLIKWNSPHQFGNEDETISSVLGKNQKSNNLIFLGRCLVWLLNKIDKDHTKKSIGE
jgi:hypothetical protein